MRAGAGMIPAAQDLVPGAPIWHLGLYRDEETLQPIRYYDKLQGYPPRLDLETGARRGAPCPSWLTPLRTV
ncbi:MAG TPA: uracil phosphoribosyltransferase [Candidatus Methylomirabilis sp.]